MNNETIKIIAIALIAIAYCIILGNFLTNKGISFYRGMVIMTPGILIISAMLALFILEFSVKETFIYLIVGAVTVAMTAIAIKTSADSIKKIMGR